MNNDVRVKDAGVDPGAYWTRHPVYAVGLVLGLAGLLAGCSDSGPAQEAGETVDETVEEVEEDLRGWVEDLREEERQQDEAGGEQAPSANEDPLRELD
ncbi:MULTISPECIES: hypothetical protein [unclassified Thioalkalivibrio]|uniref:hypothetical protein n=1 Tax=unclassified Thioalkalivibrio TaxID=2621013 RepID=UPI001E5C9B2D|nr:MULTISPECIES: hypothetical protein [unclassified Thioalkalivibrio]